MLKHVFRNTKAALTDTGMDIACALPNLRVHFRRPLPTFNRLSLYSG
jgi:hypothetical protein